MKDKNYLKDQKRRAFIKQSTLIGAGVAASTMATTRAVADVAEDAAEKPVQKGYQLTQHVLDYYKSADL